MISTKLFRGLVAIMAIAFLPVVTHAGMDEVHVVTKITGKVWVRQAIRKTGVSPAKWRKNPTFGNWRPLRKGEVINPVCEVRTEPGATVSLQMGDMIEDLATLPRDSYLLYYVVEPNSTVRCNSQYEVKHSDLVKTVRGKMRVVKTYGKASAPKY